MKFSTQAIHAGQKPDPSTGAIMTPIHLSSTFVQSSPGVHQGYEYSRTANPTRKAYETCLASLEACRFGHAMASGCAATTTVMSMFEQGDHIIAGDDMYGGTLRLFEKIIKKWGLVFTYVDMTLGAEELEKHITPKTKLVWLETPTNPMLKISPIKDIADWCKSKKVLLSVDNTFMSPYFQRPIELGADIVVHSTTKFVGGHSDMVGGAILTDSPELNEALHFSVNSIGAIASPFDSFMGLRSLKTLSLRMEAHQKNALSISKFLEGHKNVDQVIYPGLESHPQHALAKKQMHGFGGVLSFKVKGGLDKARSFLENLKVFALAESLGGVESLIEHPGIMTHASVPEAQRAALGIDDSLIRISVGIEDIEDLTKDIEQALN